MGKTVSAGPLVKVCGLTRAADALACVDAGVDWIGLNFHPASPRRIDPDVAAEIVAALPPQCTAVGLFVNRPAAEVAATADRVGLTAVQLHGDEPPADLLALGHLTVVRAFRIGDAAAVGRLRDYLSQAEALGRPPDAVLIDAYVLGVAGGTGTVIPRGVLALLPPIARLILAGGLTAANVGGRVAAVRPWMVDVAGGVESSPGVKDHGRVSAFVRAARGPGADRGRFG